MGFCSFCAIYLFLTMASVSRSLLFFVDDALAESLVGGFSTQGLSNIVSVSPSVNVGPVIGIGPSLFVAPMLRSSLNSFNLFSNRNSFNGSGNLIFVG